MTALTQLLLPLVLVFGSLPGGWLGIRLADRAQPTVAEVIPDSPAHKAGLKVGDVILQVAGKKVAGVDDLIERVGMSQAGQRLTLRIRRGGKELELRVRLAERPAADRAQARRPVDRRPAERVAGKPYLGVALDETATGVRVGEVLKGAPAERAGLRQGDVLIRFGKQRVRTLDDLDTVFKVLEPGHKLDLQVLRRGRSQRLMLIVGARPAKPAGEVAKQPAARKPAKPARSAKPALPKGFVGPKHKSVTRAWKKGAPMLLFFGADWCERCKAMRKTLENRRLQSLCEPFTRVYIDADAHAKLADEYKVEFLPHLVMLAGKTRTTVVGYQPPAKLISLVERFHSQRAKTSKTQPKQQKKAQPKKQKKAQPKKAQPKKTQPARDRAPLSREVQQAMRKLDKLDRELGRLRQEQRRQRALLQKLVKLLESRQK